MRLEPNLLLSISTGIALLLLIMTAALFGEAGGAVKYPIIAAVCVIAFVIGNGLLGRRMGRVTQPMIHLEAPTTAAWASIFPLLVILFAGIPLIWSGHDYGLLIIIAAVIFGLTVESALKAHKAV